VAGENELAGGTGYALVLYRESLPYAMQVISPDPDVMARWDLLQWLNLCIKQFSYDILELL
jgi:hypothetical protein